MRGKQYDALRSASDESIASSGFVENIDTPLPGTGYGELIFILVTFPAVGSLLSLVGAYFFSQDVWSGLKLFLDLIMLTLGATGVMGGLWVFIVAGSYIHYRLYGAEVAPAKPRVSPPPQRVIFTNAVQPPEDYAIPGRGVDRRDLKEFIRLSLRAGTWTQDTLEGTLMPSGKTMEPNLWTSLTAILAEVGILSVGGPGSPTRLLVADSEIPERLSDGGVML